MRDASLGVSLAEALAFKFDPKVMRRGAGCRDAPLEPLEGLSLRFALKWPGCVDYLSKSTQHGTRSNSAWTPARLAYEVARAVHDFYEAKVFTRYVDEGSPASDWTPERIPYDKLYLLELRQVSQRVLQPVLYYNAN